MIQPPPHRNSPPKSSGIRVAALVVVLAVVAAYANSYPGAFFFDDDAAVLRNTSIRAWTWHVLWPPAEAGVGGRPVANLTLALNYGLGAYQPWGYHATNVAVHAMAGLALFGVMRRMLVLPAFRARFTADATLIAAVVALLWSLHPVQANVVNYVSQRTEGLMGLLYLTTLYAFLRAVGGQRNETQPGWMFAAVTACALGMGTKEVMATAPLVLLLFDRAFVAGSFKAALRARGPWYLAFAATWGVLAALIHYSNLSTRGVGTSLGVPWQDYALTEVRAIVTYLRVTLWPSPLVFDYGPGFVRRVHEVLLPGAVLVASLLGTIGALWRRPMAGFALAWFFVVLAPTSTVIPIVQQPCAENRVYLPAIGIIGILVVGAYHRVGRGALVAFGTAAIAFGIATHARNPAFSSEEAIWRETYAKNPTNPRAANNLGNVLLKHDRTDEAIPYLDRALELSPTYADAWNNRGVAYLNRAQHEAAVVAFENAIRFKTGFADAYYNVGETYLQLGRNEDAIAALDRSLALREANPKAHNNRGVALLNVGRVAESLAATQRAVELEPTLPEAHYNLGNSWLAAGQLANAVAAYDRTLEIDPAFARAHNNAGVALLRMGRRDEAGGRFEAALRLRPDYQEARNNLALLRGG